MAEIHDLLYCLEIISSLNYKPAKNTSTHVEM